MNAIRVWAMSFCAGSLFLSILLFLAPDERFKRILKPVFSSFLILLMISFLTSEKGLKTNFPEVTVSGLETRDNFAQQALINAAAEAVKSQISQTLEKNSIQHKQILISMHISHTQSIVINEVVIEGVDAKDRNNCHDMLKKNLGLEVVLR